jgi:hypothetical protein
LLGREKTWSVIQFRVEREEDHVHRLHGLEGRKPCLTYNLGWKGRRPCPYITLEREKTWSDLRFRFEREKTMSIDYMVGKGENLARFSI